jgi:hypothetical protein
MEGPNDARLCILYYFLRYRVVCSRLESLDVVAEVERGRSAVLGAELAGADGVEV